MNFQSFWSSLRGWLGGVPSGLVRTIAFCVAFLVVVWWFGNAPVRAQIAREASIFLSVSEAVERERPATAASAVALARRTLSREDFEVFVRTEPAYLPGDVDLPPMLIRNASRRPGTVAVPLF